jgi:hypothetical protein
VQVGSEQSCDAQGTTPELDELLELLLPELLELELPPVPLDVDELLLDELAAPPPPLPGLSNV